MSTRDPDATAPIRPGEELPLDRLDAALARYLPDLQGPLRVEQFPSGYSNLTYLVRKGDTELVLRRPPVGARVETGHDMGREFRVLTGLQGVYPPAPAPQLYCEDPTVIGAPFFVMERRRGIVIRRALPGRLAGDADLTRRLCEALIDNLAELHGVDLDAAGLKDLGRPQGYVRRQVEGWIGRWERSKTSDLPDMDALGKWLLERIPSETGAVLVHNDYKFDNVMLDERDPTNVVAVLDWEMCTIGDPLMDLGTTLGYWLEPSDDPVWRAMSFQPTTAPGSLTRREVAERYAARTGRDVSNMLFYYAFALLKIGVIVQQIHERYVRGVTSDPRFAKLDEVVAALARMGVGAADRGRY